MYDMRKRNLLVDMLNVTRNSDYIYYITTEEYGCVIDRHRPNVKSNPEKDYDLLGRLGIDIDEATTIPDFVSIYNRIKEMESDA